MVETIKAKFGDKPGLQVWSLPRNMGKGAAVREGMLRANGEIRLFMDADNQIRIDELDAFLPLAATGRVIIGSKYADSDARIEKIEATRMFVSRLGNIIIRLLLSLELKDTQCGFKLFPAEVAEAVFRLQKLGGYAFDVEILSLVQLFQIEIMELPITLYPASESRVRTLKDSISVFADILRIKFNIWRRQYKLDSLSAESMGPSLRREL